jgi:hypothetical protein
MLPTSERLLRNRRIVESGCWEWRGGVHPNGYASTNVGSRAGGAKRRRVYVHRLAFELWRGEIPDGLDLDHLCRNRRCFNPAHLEPVTRRVNTLRGDGPAILARINGEKTHCKNGHDLSVYGRLRRSDKTWRSCTLCSAENEKRYRARKRKETR